MSDQLLIELQDEQLLAAIDAALAVLEQPAELMRDIGDKLEANVEQRFEAKVDPSGAPWAPLSPVTRAIYESPWFIARNEDFKGGVPGSLLERTRRLRNSLNSNSGADFVEVGTSRKTQNERWEVGLLHEFGTRIMPPRRLLTADPKTGELGADDQADILAIVRQAVAGAFGG